MLSRTKILKIQGWKKIYHATFTKRKVSNAIVIPYKVDFKAKSTTND